MTKTREVVTSLPYEHFLSELYGSKSYHGYVGSVRFRRWCKDVVRVINTIRKCIEINVVSDNIHMHELVTECERGATNVDKSMTIDDAACSAVKSLAMICFLLIGKNPDHFFLDQPFAEKYWVLRSERSVCYSQSIAQKAKAIVNLERHGAIGDAKKQVIESQCHRFGGNARAFVEWFKQNHTEAYLKWF